MRIVNETIEISANPRNIKYYRSMGYDINYGESIKVRVIDIPPGSTIKIDVLCDNCYEEQNVTWSRYKKTYAKYGYYVCNKCKSDKTKKTNLKKYGSTSPMGNKDILRKTQDTNLEKYGNICTLHNKDVREKVISTFNERWGGGIGSHMNDPEIVDKIHVTNLNKYGDIYPTKVNSVKERIIGTNILKYGVHNVSLIDDVKIKIKSSQFDKYGDWYFRVKKEDIKKSHFDRYGSNYMSSNEYTKNRTFKLTEEFEELSYYDFVKYNRNSIYEIYSHICGHTFSINNDNFNSRLKKGCNICTECNPIGDTKSLMEVAVCDFLSEVGVEFQSQNKDIISPKHLDIYIPSHKLAIEFNGLYWHSELFKDKKYHLDKTNQCNSVGIDLLHIWEDDWRDKKDIVKSIIRNKVNKVINRIYARKCVISSVSSIVARKFLDENHIQGFSKSKYKIGLYSEGELVSLMTFGYRRTNSLREFELIRFCNKLNTNVIGSASRLFKYFLNNYTIDEEYILSYADISLFNGNMYDMLGFDYIHLSKPNYQWVIDNKREHRWKYNKQKLIKEGYDPLKTEVEIMRSRGSYRVFGCGQKRYEYKIQKLPIDK